MPDQRTNQKAAEELACAIHGETFLRMIPAISGALAEAQQRMLDKVVVAFQDHWLWQLECNHTDKTDIAKCACGKWRSAPKRSVGDAVAEWINHVVTGLDSDADESQMHFKARG